MRRFYGLVLGLLLFFALACKQGPEEVVIDCFDGLINSETVDFGSSEDSSVSVEADKEVKVCGEQSLRIAYDLKPSGYMWIARGYGLDVKGAAQWRVEPGSIDWKRFNAIGLVMYGSNSGGVIAFDIKDAGGEMWRFLLDDDFEGWKDIICPLKQFFVRGDWQPETAERNELLDFPIMSFQFEPRLPGKGSYYFDYIRVLRIKQ